MHILLVGFVALAGLLFLYWASEQVLDVLQSGSPTGALSRRVVLLALVLAVAALVLGVVVLFTLTGAFGRA
jgi:hypothetical protein